MGGGDTNFINGARRVGGRNEKNLRLGGETTAHSVSTSVCSVEGELATMAAGPDGLDNQCRLPGLGQQKYQNYRENKKGLIKSFEHDKLGLILD